MVCQGIPQIKVTSNTLTELAEIEYDEEQEDEIPQEILDLLEGNQGILEPNFEDTETVNLGFESNPKDVRIGTSMGPEQRSAMINFLKSYSDVFAWSYADMPGLDPALVVHRLPLIPEIRPVKQKLRRMRPEWSQKSRWRLKSRLTQAS